MSLIYFSVLLSILIFVHELGHFIQARREGVRVEKFSFGFGPKIFSIKRGDTEYLLSAIPLGGYVKMAGDEPGEELKHREWEFLSKSVMGRFKIIFAGPLLNYLLAFVIFSVIFMFGSPTLTTRIGGLLKDYPAEAKGLAMNDRIISVDGQDVAYWEDMTEIIRKHTAAPMRLKIDRKGKVFEVEITPIVRETKDIFGVKAKIALIGISPSQEIEKVRYGPIASLGMGFKKLMHLTFITYKAFFLLLTGRMAFKESMTGPIGIFIITGKAAELGLIYVFHLMAILSASLAIFNLLPFPVLDGGHIMLLIVEKIRGRPLSAKTQEWISNFGVSVLILLMLAIFYNDMINFRIFEKVSSLFKR